MSMVLRSLLCFALLSFSAFAAPSRNEDPSPGECRQSLDGEWLFTTDAAQLNQTTGWGKITVPGNWDTLPEYSTYTGKGWYRRSFALPAGWKGKKIRLRFEAVYHAAEVSLNGQSLGTHVGGYTPFEFDVTDKLNCNGPNTVTVCADNTYSRGAWWPWGGISRSVALIANNEARIVRQHIRSEPDLATGAARVFVQYKLINTGSADLQTEVTAKIGQANNSQESTVQQLTTTIPAGETVLREIIFNLPASKVRLWHFDHPNLYTLTTSLQCGGKQLHARTDRFGIRKVEIKPDGLYLNGEHIRVPGFNRVSDSNRFGNTEPDELIRQDVDLMKKAGAVMSRLMHTPQAPNLLDYLDEKGMMIFCEIPVWGAEDPNQKPHNPLLEQWMTEMIERDYNHPCIIGWSSGNELWGHYAYVESMNHFIRKLDPDRIVTYVSNTASNPRFSPKDDPLTVSDVAMVNFYGGPGAFAKVPGILRNGWPDKSVFFAEIGVNQLGASLEAKIPKAEEVWAAMTKEPYVIGGAVWTFNDYRSKFKGTPASGNREWGVVDVERHPKAAYWQIRKIYSPVHSISVENGRVLIQPRSLSESPSYTLRGYHIAWKLTDASGTTTASGTLPLPDLAPDAPDWSAPIPGALGAKRVSVSLVSPTGYDVDDASNMGEAKQ